MVLSSLPVPIVLAPLAGGPSTPELAAAVAGAGGLGFVAGGYLTAPALAEQLDSARSLCDGPIGVNVFVPGAAPTEPDVYRRFVTRLQSWAQQEGVELGEPRFSDDGWEAKLDLLERAAPPVVSFTFGCPDTAVVSRLHAAGSEVWVTVTEPQEARQAAGAGADVLVVQGAEAGGHRGSFIDRADLPLYGLLPLLALIREVVSLPLVASGGIATGAALAAVLCAGATAAQIGTAFMLCPEAGTSAPHRAILSTPAQTALTRAFTGRLARGVRNSFLDEFSADAPIAYPELHYMTAPLRRRAREVGDPEHVNLWAGEAHPLAQAEPAAHVVRRLHAQANAALASARPTPDVWAPGDGAPETAVSRASLATLARDWYDAWNAHDLERVLSHYSDDIVFSSPLIVALGAAESATISGKPRLRASWSRALQRFPDLHFEPLDAFYGASSVVLRYRTVVDLEAVEVLEVGPDGLVARASAHYDRLP